MIIYQTTKILQCKMIRCLKHPKMTIIVPAIDDDDLDDTIQFGNPVTQPFLSRSVRVPTQMFQGYLHEYPPPSQADTYS